MITFLIQKMRENTSFLAEKDCQQDGIDLQKNILPSSMCAMSYLFPSIGC